MVQSCCIMLIPLFPAGSTWLHLEHGCFSSHLHRLILSLGFLHETFFQLRHGGICHCHCHLATWHGKQAWKTCWQRPWESMVGIAKSRLGWNQPAAVSRFKDIPGLGSAGPVRFGAQDQLVSYNSSDHRSPASLATARALSSPAATNFRAKRWSLARNNGHVPKLGDRFLHVFTSLNPVKIYENGDFGFCKGHRTILAGQAEWLNWWLLRRWCSETGLVNHINLATIPGNL